MTRKASWLFAAIVVAAVLAPQAVLAAAGNFSTNATTPAVTGDNTRTGTSVAPGGRFTCKANGCRALWVDSYGVGSSSYGLAATSRDPSGRGAAGINAATTGAAIGVYGQTASSTGRAVVGLSTRTGGLTYGGFFESRSSTAGATGVFGYISSQLVGNGPNYGVYGRNDGGAPNASGVFGFATKQDGNPQVNGVWGRAPSTNGAGLFGEGGAYGFYGSGGYIGGFGFGQQAGVAGDTCDTQDCTASIGDGTFGLLSYTDAGVVGHLVQGEVGNIAGTCAVAASTAPQPCTFAHAFPVAPLVVATPAGDPNSGQWWIQNVTTTGFEIVKSSSGTAATFNWIAIGIDSGMSTLAPRRLDRARRAG